MSAAELASPENAIWLCSNHASLVDTNRGVLYPEALLRSWKALHEARIAREHRGISSPLGWFHSMRVNTGPLFATPIELIFGKVSIISGANSIGKTALWEWLAGISDERYLSRWLRRSAPTSLLDVEVSYFDPLERRIRFSISEKQQLDYQIAGQPVPFQPHAVRFVQLKEPYEIHGWDKLDDLAKLAAMFSLAEPVVRKVLESTSPDGTNLIPSWKIDQRGINRTILLRQNDDFDLPLSQASHSQLAFFAMEVATTVAAFSAEYVPTLLILDSFAAALDNRHLIEATMLLSNETNRFQTIMTIPTRDIDYSKLSAAGANLFYLRGTIPTVTISTSRNPCPSAIRDSMG